MNKTMNSHTVRSRSHRVIRAFSLTACMGAMVLSVASLRAQRGTSTAPATIVQKRDSMTITLPPLQRIEVKLVMKKGEKAQYTWKADSADVTYNLHAEGPDAPGGKAHTYSRGSSRGEKGEIIAAFDGVHGWSWRNTTEKPVRVSVTAWGQFSELKKM